MTALTAEDAGIIFGQTIRRLGAASSIESMRQADRADAAIMHGAQWDKRYPTSNGTQVRLFVPFRPEGG